MAAAAGGGGAGGAIGGAAVGGVMGIFQGLIEQEFAEKNMRKAQHYAQRMARNRYQWARQDLEAAGLNPMLAFGGVPGGHGASAPQTPDFDIAGGALRGAEFARVAAQTELLKAEAAKVRAETPKQETLGTGWKFILEKARELGGTSARGIPGPTDESVPALLEKIREGFGTSSSGTTKVPFMEQPEIKALVEHLRGIWSNEKAPVPKGLQKQPGWSAEEKKKLRIGNPSGASGSW